MKVTVPCSQAPAGHLPTELPVQRITVMGTPTGGANPVSTVRGEDPSEAVEDLAGLSERDAAFLRAMEAALALRGKSFATLSRRPLSSGRPGLAESGSDGHPGI